MSAIPLWFKRRDYLKQELLYSAFRIKMGIMNYIKSFQFNLPIYKSG